LLHQADDLRQPCRTIGLLAANSEIDIHLLMNHSLPGVNAGYIIRSKLVHSHLRAAQQQISDTVFGGFENEASTSERWPWPQNGRDRQEPAREGRGPVTPILAREQSHRLPFPFRIARRSIRSLQTCQISICSFSIGQFVKVRSTAARRSPIGLPDTATPTSAARLGHSATADRISSTIRSIVFGDRPWRLPRMSTCARVGLRPSCSTAR
jgi:hypothetical protein